MARRKRGRAFKPESSERTVQKELRGEFPPKPNRRKGGGKPRAKRLNIKDAIRRMGRGA